MVIKTKTFCLVLSLSFFYVSAARSPLAAYPDELIHQIIPSGPPWPVNTNGYIELSQTTQKPVSTVQILLADRIDTEEKVETTTRGKPDFHRDPWTGLSTEDYYWLGSVQELPFE